MRRVNHSEQSKPGVAFTIYIPIKFDLALSINIQNSLRQKYRINEEKKSYNFGEKFREKMLEFFDAKNEFDFIDKVPTLRKKVAEIRELIKDEMGLGNREFSSKWAKPVAELLLKEDNVINIEKKEVKK